MAVGRSRGHGPGSYVSTVQAALECRSEVGKDIGLDAVQVVVNANPILHSVAFAWPVVCPRTLFLHISG